MFLMEIYNEHLKLGSAFLQIVTWVYILPIDEGRLLSKSGCWLCKAKVIFQICYKHL